MLTGDDDKLRDQVRDPLVLASGHQLRNRLIALPAAGRAHVTSAGWPTESMNRMYAERASGGFALVYVHATIVDPLCTTPAELILADKSALSAFADLADAIRSSGALAGIQIISHWQNDFPYAMSALSVTEIEETIARHVRGAELAAEAGFDVINLQASHGWPVQRFVSALTNDRTDRYGAPEYVPGRIMADVKKAIGDSCAISWRLSVNEFAGPRGITPALIRDTVMPALAAEGCDLFDLSLGRSAVLPRVRDHLANETTYSSPAQALANFAGFRGATPVPVSVRGRITSVAAVADALTYGDLVGVGRQSMADPQFANKILGYDTHRVRECIGCNYCLDRVVRQELPVRCAVNWSFNRQPVALPDPVLGAPQRSVLVVGGGVAGLTAAVSLARAGVSVTLREAGAEFGGQLRELRELERLNLSMLFTVVDGLLEEAIEEKVELALSEAVDVDVEASSGRWDAIVVATGARRAQHALDLPPGLVSARPADALDGAGSDVVLVGRGGEGAEWAVELGARGRRVVLVDTSDSATLTTYDYDARRAEALDELLAEGRVERHEGVLLDGVETADDGRVRVRFAARDGIATEVTGESVCFFGREPSRGRTPAPRDSLEHGSIGGTPVVFVGDCVRPLGIAEAVDAGERAARALATTVRGAVARAGSNW